MVGVLLAGCGSPGRPLPPSLHLPGVVGDLRAARVGDAVELRWTTPSATTDGVGLKGEVSTEICREVVTSPVIAAGTACTVVQRLDAAQGTTLVEETLPGTLLAEPAGALVYRVRLLNAAGKSAGLSNASYAASGQAPAGVTGLRATPAAAGVRLEWAPATGPAAAMEMLRTDLGAAAGKPATHVAATGSSQPARVSKGRKARPVGAEVATDGRGVVRLLVDAAPAVGSAQAGSGQQGAIDPTAGRDEEYQYVLTRVRTVRAAGQSLELRGPASAAVVVRAQDLAPPAVPKELVAAADGRTVALSWEPGFEADLAGYRVYRAEAVTVPDTMPPAAPWQPVQAQLVAVPNFQDAVPHDGEFWYRVTAVDRSGNESAAGDAVAVRARPRP